MASNFHSFDQSPLKAFTQSPLKGRNGDVKGDFFYLDTVNSGTSGARLWSSADGTSFSVLMTRAGGTLGLLFACVSTRLFFTNGYLDAPYPTTGINTYSFGTLDQLYILQSGVLIARNTSNDYYRSTNNGTSWSAISIPAPNSSGYSTNGKIASNVWQAQDGTIIIIQRATNATLQSRIYRIFSTDDGATWTGDAVHTWNGVSSNDDFLVYEKDNTTGVLLQEQTGAGAMRVSRTSGDRFASSSNPPTTFSTTGMPSRQVIGARNTKTYATGPLNVGGSTVHTCVYSNDDFTSSIATNFENCSMFVGKDGNFYRTKDTAGTHSFEKSTNKGASWSTLSATLTSNTRGMVVQNGMKRVDQSN